MLNHIRLKNITYHLLDCIRNEYKRNEAGETLLREPGHIFDDVASI